MPAARVRAMRGAGQGEVERREVVSDVVQQVGRRAAQAEADGRAEEGVVVDGDAEFAGPAGLALHEEPVRGRADGGGGLGDGGGVLQAKEDAGVAAAAGAGSAAVLEHGGETQQGGGVGGVPGGVDGPAGHDGHAVSGKDVEGFVLGEAVAALGADAGEDAADGVVVGGQAEDAAGWQLGGGGAGAALADQVGEGLDRGFGGGEDREPGICEGAAMGRPGGLA